MKFITFGIFALVANLSHAALSPRETIERVDSLIRAGSGEQARALFTGQALRLLPMLIQTEKNFARYLDKARSHDTILAETQQGDWTALKIYSVSVFMKPMVGMDSLASYQAVHLYREGGNGGIWKVADFEELPGNNAPLVLRQGTPSGVADAKASLLPTSRYVPVKNGATRLRLRLSLRGGDTLPVLTGSAGQMLIERGGTQGPTWVLVDTRRAPLPDSVKKYPGVSTVYLASTPDLDLTDPLLQARAATLKSGSPHAVATARRTYDYVATHFNYKLGAALFGTSREALRSLKGDCSEAAMLTAALLRANGIPSRVVMGFATLDRGVFIGHAWAEAWLGGAWIGVDPALRQFPAGAGRIALIQLTGEQRMQPIATNLMVSTLANLDIEITHAWAGDERLALVEQSGTEKDITEFLNKVMEGMAP